MFDFISHLFTSDFMPHGHCYLWQPGILWLNVISDVLIVLAYYSIPFALGYLVWNREDLVFNRIFLMFAAFIFACGTTHAMEVWTVWHGTYRLAGVVKLITAVLSVSTAFALRPLVFTVINFPNVSQLQREIEQRVSAQAELGKVQLQLEDRVQERTKALKMINSSLRDKSDKLQRFYNVAENRELEMIKLKHEIDELLSQLNRPYRYYPPLHDELAEPTKNYERTQE